MREKRRWRCSVHLHVVNLQVMTRRPQTMRSASSHKKFDRAVPLSACNGAKKCNVQASSTHAAAVVHHTTLPVHCDWRLWVPCNGALQRWKTIQARLVPRLRTKVHCQHRVSSTTFPRLYPRLPRADFSKPRGLRANGAATVLTGTNPTANALLSAPPDYSGAWRYRGVTAPQGPCEEYASA